MDSPEVNIDSLKYRDSSNDYSTKATMEIWTRLQKEMMLSDDLMDLIDMFAIQEVDLNFYKRVRSDYEKSRRDPR